MVDAVKLINLVLVKSSNQSETEKNKYYLSKQEGQSKQSIKNDIDLSANWIESLKVSLWSEGHIFGCQAQRPSCEAGILEGLPPYPGKVRDSTSQCPAYPQCDVNS